MRRERRHRGQPWRTTLADNPGGQPWRTTQADDSGGPTRHDKRAWRTDRSFVGVCWCSYLAQICAHEFQACLCKSSRHCKLCSPFRAAGCWILVSLEKPQELRCDTWSQCYELVGKDFNNVRVNHPPIGPQQSNPSLFGCFVTTRDRFVIDS